MALPRARKIEVDGKTYEWLVKPAKAKYDEDHWGNEIACYDRTVTVRSPAGKVLQRTFEYQTVSPKMVTDLIRTSVQQGVL